MTLTFLQAVVEQVVKLRLGEEFLNDISHGVAAQATQGETAVLTNTHLTLSPEDRERHIGI